MWLLMKSWSMWLFLAYWGGRHCICLYSSAWSLYCAVLGEARLFQITNKPGRKLQLDAGLVSYCVLLYKVSHGMISAKMPSIGKAGSLNDPCKLHNIFKQQKSVRPSLPLQPILDPPSSSLAQFYSFPTWKLKRFSMSFYSPILTPVH